MTVILLLFAPPADVVHYREPAGSLLGHRDMFLSKRAADCFIGYLDRQRDRMLGKLSQRTNRPELVARYGWDVKFGYHAARLGMQGVEYLSTGRITLPIPEAEREWLLAIRHGQVPQNEVLAAVESYRSTLIQLREQPGLSGAPNYERINEWLYVTYQRWWRGDRFDAAPLTLPKPRAQGAL